MGCAMTVYVTYASDRGHALIDRALYLPQSWADDTERRGQAGVPDDVEFATKSALAPTDDHPGARRWCPRAVGRRG